MERFVFLLDEDIFISYWTNLLISQFHYEKFLKNLSNKQKKILYIYKTYYFFQIMNYFGRLMRI